MERKSVFSAFMAGLLFGPLGLMYVSPAGGLFIGVLMFVSAPTVFVPMLLWICCALYAPEKARQINRVLDGKKPW